MSVGPVTVEIISMFGLAVFLIHRYGNVVRQHAAVTLSVLIAWYFSFIIIFILPLDVSSTAYRQCLYDKRLQPIIPPLTTTDATTSSTTTTTAASNSTNVTFLSQFPNNTTDAVDADDVPCQVPWSHIPENVLPNLWRVVYWTSQCLTWIILPLMQSYSQAGDFTVTGKLKSALIDNAIYYGSYLLIFGILLIYIAAKPNLDLDMAQLKVICITASNTWGLFLLVLLLGYGLVEVPRTCWNSAKRGYMLNYAYFKAAKLSTEKSESEEALDDVLDDIQRIAESIRSSHPLRKHVDTILEKCPDTFKAVVSNPTRRRNSDSDANFPVQTPTEKSLIRVHRQLIKALKTQRRTHTQWNILIDRALQLEDISRNEDSNERCFKTAFQVARSQWIRALYTPTIEWYWKCLIRGWVLRLLAVSMATFSVIVVWSEVTFFNKYPVLSLFAYFVDLAKRNYFEIEIVSILTLAYLCICTYYTVFKIRVLNYYYLAPYHQTDEYSLIFSGMLLCRLTPPMCLNFLGLIHLDSHVTRNHDMVETAYTEIMGHLDVISFISDGVNIYLPILILLLCLATYFNLGSQCLHLIGFQQFIGDDDMTSDLIEEGRELIKREKRKRQRAEDGELRRRQFNEKLSGGAVYKNSRPKDHISNSREHILRRDDSVESTRAELLRDIEPIDYTTENSDGGDQFRTYTSGNIESNLYQSVEQDRWSYSPRRWTNQPPRGIFDDV